MVAFGEARDGLVLALSEGFFTVLHEDLGDRSAVFGLDDVVHIDKAPAQ